MRCSSWPTHLLCTDGPVKTLVGLSLAPEHRRGHGARYDALTLGRIDVKSGHTYGRGKDEHRMIPGWPYSIVAALETGRTSWTALLDAVRLPPGADVTTLTCAQIHQLVDRLTNANIRYRGPILGVRIAITMTLFQAAGRWGRRGVR